MAGYLVLILPTLAAIALIPKQEIGLTSFSEPTLFVFIPETDAKTVTFHFSDLNDAAVFTATVPINLTGVPEIWSYQLPPEIKLEPNRSYNWSFRPDCQPLGSETNRPVSGKMLYSPVALSEPEANQRLSLAQAQWYYQEGFWYDAIALLAQLRLADADNPELKQQWTEWLAGTPGAGIIEDQLRGEMSPAINSVNPTP